MLRCQKNGGVAEIRTRASLATPNVLAKAELVATAIFTVTIQPNLAFFMPVSSLYCKHFAAILNVFLAIGYLFGYPLQRCALIRESATFVYVLSILRCNLSCVTYLLPVIFIILLFLVKAVDAQVRKNGCDISFAIEYAIHIHNLRLDIRNIIITKFLTETILRFRERHGSSSYN